MLILYGCNEVNLKLKNSFSTASGFSITNVSVVEGNDLVFTVNLATTSTEVTNVTYTTINGSALAGTNYSSSSGTLTFNPGETSQTITIPTVAIPSEVCASDRTLTVQLSNPVGAAISRAAASGIITDPDVPSVSISAGSGTEGGNVSFTASLSAACPTKTVSFSLAPTSGTALSGTDFSASSITGSITAGAISGQVNVPSINDSIYEGTETFTATISAPVNATLGTTTATGSILDNDSMPVVNFAVASQSFNESGGTATINISLSNASTQIISIPFTLTGTATSGLGNDYTITASPVSISAGSTSTTVSVVINNDILSENNETVILTLGTPTNATKGTTDTHTLTIVDNDVASVSSLTSPNANNTYTSGSVDVHVVFSGPVTVVGTPLLNLNTTPARFASYVSGSGTSTLVFTYNIEYSDASADLDAASTSALVLSGGTIQDTLKTTNANLTLPTPGTAGSLGANKNIVINGDPGILSVTIPPDGISYLADGVDFTVVFSEAVTVTGTPVINMSIGGTPVSASYVSGSGSPNLVFRYVVGANVVGDGPVLTSPINLSGGTIKRGVGVNAGLTFTYASTTGILVDGRTITIGLSSPSLVVPESAGYNIPLTIELSAAALVSHTIPVSTFGKANKPSDYDISASGSVVIPAGQTSITIDVDIFEDSIPETSEFFNIVLDRPSIKSNLVLSQIYGTRVSILDYDDNVSLDDQWAMISTGENNSCGITNDATLKCWGLNYDGRVGDNTLVDKASPVTIDPGVSYYKVSAWSDVTCAITTGRKMKCWGTNNGGSLGDGTLTPSITPKAVNPAENYAEIAVSEGSVCAITLTGVLHCWGWFPSSNSGAYGVLTPTVIDSGTSYKAVSVGSRHRCAITTTDALKCWGSNGSGQTGNGTVTFVPSPVLIDAGESYLAVEAGQSHTCGITTSNALKCWGDNQYGQIGDGTSLPILTPTLIDSGVSYSVVSSGYSETCGITTGNVLKCWGYVTGMGYWNYSNTPIIIEPFSPNYNFISVGSGFTCGISFQVLKCWGRNTYGSLGSGLKDVSPFPVAINQESFVQVSTGDGFMCGLNSTGWVKCWGNIYSTVGDGTESYRQTPVRIDPGTNYKTVVVGGEHACGITSTDSIKCWGANYSGQIGDGTYDNKTAPVFIDPGVTYQSLDLGYYHSCGITLSGVLKCWGDNYDGQLGTGDGLEKLTPTVIDSGVTYAQISTTDSHACGITTTGILKCWGRNSVGQLGDGTTVNQPLPVIIDPGESYVHVEGASWYTCAITTSGVLKCWGYNLDGNLGDGTSVNKSSPVIIDPGISYQKISATDQTCGITTAEVLKCWGDNSAGVVGDGTLNNRLSPVIIDSGISYREISTSYEMTCGITNTNITKCWGNRDTGNIYGDKFPQPVGDF